MNEIYRYLKANDSQYMISPIIRAVLRTIESFPSLPRAALNDVENLFLSCQVFFSKFHEIHTYPVRSTICERAGLREIKFVL